MSRSRPRKKRKVKRSNRAFWAFFIIGAAVGFLSIVIYTMREPVACRTAPKKAAPGTKIVSPAPKRAQPLGKIAIVLDDFGYNYKNAEALIALKTPITFSILPGLPYSKTVARRVSQKGFEAILHLPLEAHEHEALIRPEERTITTKMKKEEVVSELDKAILGMPDIKGVSGHQGSKATENPVLMRIIFDELKARGLFFLDSLVSSRSVCKKAARDSGVKFAKRDVFLDNEPDYDYIKGQFLQLEKRARRVGFAIGVGHDRETTAAALAKLIPEAKQRGIEFVFLSEVVK